VQLSDALTGQRARIGAGGPHNGWETASTAARETGLAEQEGLLQHVFPEAMVQADRRGDGLFQECRGTPFPVGLAVPEPGFCRQTKQEQGKINLLGAVAELVSPLKYKSQHCMELRSPSQQRVFVLQAANDKEAREWSDVCNR
jgi:hypothetical protein